MDNSILLYILYMMMLRQQNMYQLRSHYMLWHQLSYTCLHHTPQALMTLMHSSSLLDIEYIHHHHYENNNHLSMLW